VASYFAGEETVLHLPVAEPGLFLSFRDCDFNHYAMWTTLKVCIYGIKEKKMSPQVFSLKENFFQKIFLRFLRN
jgi:hypothetical protein